MLSNKFNEAWNFFPKNQIQFLLLGFFIHSFNELQTNFLFTAKDLFVREVKVMRKDSKEGKDEKQEFLANWD